MMASNCSKVTAGVAGTALAGLFIAATVYTGMYAFNNPDPETCWVVRNLDQPSRTKAEVLTNADIFGVPIPQGYPLEMHNVYLAWFLWGFYSKCIITGLLLIAASLYMCGVKAAKLIGGLSCGLYLGNFVIWIAVGGIWRFSRAGATTSGDMLERLFGITDQEWAD